MKGERGAAKQNPFFARNDWNLFDCLILFIVVMFSLKHSYAKKRFYECIGEINNFFSAHKFHYRKCPILFTWIYWRLLCIANKEEAVCRCSLACEAVLLVAAGHLPLVTSSLMGTSRLLAIYPLSLGNTQAAILSLVNSWPNVPVVCLGRSVSIFYMFTADQTYHIYLTEASATRYVVCIWQSRALDSLDRRILCNEMMGFIRFSSSCMASSTNVVFMSVVSKLVSYLNRWGR